MEIEPNENLSRRGTTNKNNIVQRNHSGSQERSRSQKMEYRDALLRQINDKKKSKVYNKKMSGIESDYSFFNSMGDAQPFYRSNDGSN